MVTAMAAGGSVASLWRSWSNLTPTAALSGRRLLTAENEVNVDGPDESEGPVVDSPPLWKEVQAFLAYVTTSSLFSGLIMVIILINGVSIAVETDTGLAERHTRLFASIDIVSIAIYTLEFVLKNANPATYWSDGYNRFDFAILLLSYVQLAFSSLSLVGDFAFLRVIRALRALRALRSVRFFRSLQVLVQAFWKTLQDVVYLMFFLFILMFVYGIAGYYLYGEDDQDPEHWGTLGRALLSLCTFVTVDGWTKLQTELDAISELTRLYTVSFILLSSFVFLNLLVGLVVFNLDRSASIEKERRRKARQDAYRRKKLLIQERQRRDMELLVEKTRISPEENIDALLQAMAGTLRHDEMVPMTNVVTSMGWIDAYLASLSYHENSLYRVQQLHFELINTMSEIVERRLSDQVGV